MEIPAPRRLIVRTGMLPSATRSSRMNRTNTTRCELCLCSLSLVLLCSVKFLLSAAVQLTITEGRGDLHANLKQ